MDYHALGQRIKEQRKRLGFTQSKVASCAGISIAFCGHIERGTRKASVETLLSIARVLETTPDDLLHIGPLQEDPMPQSVMECVRAARAQLDQIEAFYDAKTGDPKRTRSHAGERG